MSVRVLDSRRPPRSPALPISSGGSSSPSRHMSSSPSSGIMMISPSSSPKPPSSSPNRQSKVSGSEQMKSSSPKPPSHRLKGIPGSEQMKLGRNYAAFQQNSRDLLHRQQSVDGRRSKQKRLAVPSRSHSLKHQQRLSSSTGHLDRRASVTSKAVRNETTVYFVDTNLNNNNEEDDTGEDKSRQMNPALNIPSRQASVRSYGSGKSVISPPLSRGNSSRQGGGGDSSRISACSQQGAFPITYNNNSLLAVASQFPWSNLPSKERRHRKVACAVFIFSSFLLASAVVCTLVSLHRSPHIDEKVRKENEHLLKSIQQTATNYNATTTSTTTGSTTLQSEDTLNNNHNNNSNNNFSIVGSQSLPRTTDNLNNQGAEEDYSGNSNDEARKEKMILDGTADDADQ